MHPAHGGAVTPASISVIKFSSSREAPGAAVTDHVLFVGDSKGAGVFAYELGPAAAAPAQRAFALQGIDQKIADVLGVTLDQLAIRDLAIHPATGEAYIAVQRGHGPAAIPVIVCVNTAGEVRPLDLSTLPHQRVSLPSPVGEDVVLWNHVVARTLAITDLEFVSGELFVSGLSNAEFASTLYRIPYPFTGTLHQSSIEMYHGMHGQNETRAPIQTMTVLPLNGKPHVLAAYTCTPLVTIPLDQLTDGAHVKGKTIGELGYGNAPIDMLHFHSQDMHGQKGEHVLITHKTRGAMLFDLSALAERNEQEGITTPLSSSLAGPAHTPVPLAGVLHIDVQGPQFLAALRRDMETGRLDLVSFRKGMYFRLGDFVSEYMLPGFPMAAMPERFRQYYGMMQGDEGVIAK